MALDFITSNPTTGAYYTGQDKAEKQALLDQQLGVDTAVRQGITQMLQKPPPAYQSPSAAPSSPVVAGPAATDQAASPAAAQTAGPTLPVPPIPPATPPPATAQADDPNLGPTAVQMRQMRVAPTGPDVDAIMQGMSRGAAPPAAAPPATPPATTLPPAQPRRPEANATSPATTQLAMANPGTMTDASPGFIPAGWFGDPQKERTLNAIVHRESRGQNIPNQQGPGGTPLSTASGPFQDINSTWAEGKRLAGIDPNLYPTAMSAPSDVQIRVNSAIYDKYGTSPWKASEPGHGGMPAADAGRAAIAGVGPPGMSFMPGYNTSRYDPILQSLAATPGGGNAALKLLTEQGRFDQNNYRRSDNYQRLAMSALAHGDTATARYYAEAGGMQLPESVMSNQGNAVLLGRGSLLAHRIYGSDPEQAMRFTQTFLTNGGDVTGAFNAAGVPRSNPQYKLGWAQQEDGSMRALTFSPRTGQIAPATDQSGQPVMQAPKPNQGSLTLDHKVNMLVTTGMPYNEAVQAATGVGVRPQAVASAYRGFYASYANSLAGMNAPEPERQAAVETQMVNVFGPNWRNVMGQGQPQGGTPQAAPGGGAALPTAPAGAGAPSSYQPPSTAPPQPQAGTAVPQQAGTPGQGGPQAAPTPGDVQQSIANARAAIAQGKPRAAVLKRLQDLNIPIPPDL